MLCDNPVDNMICFHFSQVLDHFNSDQNLNPAMSQAFNNKYSVFGGTQLGPEQ